MMLWSGAERRRSALPRSVPRTVPANGLPSLLADAIVPAAMVVGMLVSGCGSAPHVQQTMNAPLFDDVMAIMCTIRPKPWVNFDMANPTKINGLAVNMYLISATTQKGVFGAGTIRVFLYEPQEPSTVMQEAGAQPGQHAVGKLLHEWVLPPEQAMPFRVVRRPDRTYVMGDGYQLRLSWGDLDLAGRHIVLVIEYQRTDGRLVRRPPFWLQVPARGRT